MHVVISVEDTSLIHRLKRMLKRLWQHEKHLAKAGSII